EGNERALDVFLELQLGAVWSGVEAPTLGDVAVGMTELQRQFGPVTRIDLRLRAPAAAQDVAGVVQRLSIGIVEADEPAPLRRLERPRRAERVSSAESGEVAPELRGDLQRASAV